MIATDDIEKGETLFQIPREMLLHPGTAEIRDLLAESELFKPCHKKTCLLGFDQVRHKPGCTAIEDRLRLEIKDLGSRGFVQSTK